MIDRVGLIGLSCTIEFRLFTISHRSNRTYLPSNPVPPLEPATEPDDIAHHRFVFAVDRAARIKYYPPSRPLAPGNRDEIIHEKDQFAKRETKSLNSFLPEGLIRRGADEGGEANHRHPSTSSFRPRR